MMRQLFFGFIYKQKCERTDVGCHNKQHIHVRYQGKKSSISLKDGSVLAGDFSAKQLRLVLALIDIHKDELMADWKLVASGEEPFRFAPLQQAQSLPLRITTNERLQNHGTL